MVERPKPQQSGMSSLIVGTTLLVVGVSLGTLTLLLGGGILAAVFYLATALLLQYLLWGWWLGPILHRRVAQEEAEQASLATQRSSDAETFSRSGQPATRNRD
jgi:hypothetical protein